MKEKPRFPLEKILSMTAQEYVGPNVNVKEHYEIKGIHLVTQISKIGYNSVGSQPIMEEFADYVPEGTEIVVSYRDSLAFNNDQANHECPVSFSAHADALIPNKKTSKKK